MTLNVTVASPSYVISCSDRRLTWSHTGKIVTENSTKLTILKCIDALSLISYNGIGKHQDKTPSDWLHELNQKVKLTDLPFKEVLLAIRQETERRIIARSVYLDTQNSS